jgi:hypothetical protein
VPGRDKPAAIKPKPDGSCVRDRVSSKLGMLQPRDGNPLPHFRVRCFARLEASSAGLREKEKVSIAYLMRDEFK